MTTPLTFRWEGDSFVPANRFMANRADQEFVIGQTYRLVEHHERSGESHRHYFAALHEAWQNLPEKAAERFPTSEHFRKFALIKTGHYDKEILVATTPEEARKFAAFLKPIDEFAIVTVEGCTVSRYTPKSQSLRAMGKKDFQKSKQDVLDYAASLIGVEPEQLKAEAGRAA